MEHLLGAKTSSTWYKVAGVNKKVFSASLHIFINISILLLPVEQLMS